MRSSHAALAATAALVLATPALAATPHTMATGIRPAAGGSRSVTSAVTNAPATDIGDITASIAMTKFNPARGILVGAKLDVDVPIKLNLTGNVSNFGAGQISASYTGQILGIGMTPIVGTKVTGARTCGFANCTSNPATGTLTGRVTGSATVASASLAAYAGTGTVGIQAKATGSTTATKTGTSATGRLTATSEVIFGQVASNVANVATLTYSYLDFASPSFDATDPTVRALTLDFGTVRAGTAARSLAFSLNNIGGASTAGLSLKSIVSTGSGFTTDLATFTDGLAGGQSGNYAVTLKPTAAGTYDQSLALTFEDFAPGGVGVRSYQLTLRATGTVLAAPVPEPASWAMMIAGFGLVGGAMRRTRRGAPYRAA